MLKRLFSAAAVLAGSGLLWGGAAAGAVTSTGGLPASLGGPMIRAHSTGFSNYPTVSLNWSGYAATSTTKFSKVSGEWVQPAITCTGKKDINQNTSNWVGLDGYANETVEQDGTAAWCTFKSGGMQPAYNAWIEMYPLPEVIAYPVHPGDIMQGSVSYSGGQFSLTITDETTGESRTQSAPCSTCKRTSAEWIIERPAYCNSSFTHCYLTELANYDMTEMYGDVARAGKVTGGVSAFNNYPIFMVSPLKKGFVTLDTVSALDNSSNGFNAQWDRAGTKYPITLGPRGSGRSF